MALATYVQKCGIHNSLSIFDFLIDTLSLKMRVRNCNSRHFENKTHLKAN